MVMENLLGATTPVGNFSNGATAIALGTAIKFSVDGWVYGHRMYVNADFNPAAHIPFDGELWQTSSGDDAAHFGVRLAKKQYSGVTPGTWNETFYDTPVAVTANTPYRTIYYAASGFYVASSHFFTSADVVSGNVVGYKDGTDVGLGHVSNGTYLETADPDEHYTINTFNETCYFADVLFSTDPPGGGGGDPGEASRFFFMF